MAVAAESRRVVMKGTFMASSAMPKPSPSSVNRVSLDSAVSAVMPAAQPGSNQAARGSIDQGRSAEDTDAKSIRNMQRI